MSSTRQHSMGQPTFTEIQDCKNIIVVACKTTVDERRYVTVEHEVYYFPDRTTIEVLDDIRDNIQQRELIYRVARYILQDGHGYDVESTLSGMTPEDLYNEITTGRCDFLQFIVVPTIQQADT